MLQLDPASSVVAQAFSPVAIAKSAGFAPPIAMLPIASGAVPVFVSVAVNGADVVPLSVSGNASVAVSFAAGAGGAVPVPVKAVDCAPGDALSETVKRAEKVATAEGVNVT